jgi:hypothetical protein
MPFSLYFCCHVAFPIVTLYLEALLNISFPGILVGMDWCMRHWIMAAVWKKRNYQ